MPGINVNHPSTPSGLALVVGHGMWVCDKDGLRGSPGLLVPGTRAWAAQADGSMHQFWPVAPVIVAGPGVGPSVLTPSDWRIVSVGWNAPGATTISITARVGSGTPVVVFTGANPTFWSAFSRPEWNWFNAGPQFQPGATAVFEMTALNESGSSVASSTVVLPTIPKPAAAPVASSIGSVSCHLDWSASQVVGAVDYVVTRSPGAVTQAFPGTSGLLGGLAPSTSYSFTVYARVRATYTGAPLLASPASAARAVKTLAPVETGPPNGVYQIAPSTPATYQWGQSGGQAAGWRSTSDDFFHGDGSSYGSSRGIQATFFFYARPSAWSAGLGTKTCARFQIYLVRQAGTGDSAGVLCRWGIHGYASKPAGGPGIAAGFDNGALAWNQGAWIDLPVSWGAQIVAAQQRGIVWGYVAGRYMSSQRNPGAGTPNGTIRITIAN